MTPAQRATSACFSWRNVGENIAAGPTTAPDVVTLWLKSPGHCANIMSPEFTHMGLAFAEDRKRQSGVYWAQEFGRPR
ncbi:MAG: CAP domain-containing protein [Steroidobacteraceae bacterium]